MSTAIGTHQRFTATNPCPICGGHPDMPRGKGERCVGFRSSDPDYVHCTREEYANSLTVNERTTPPTYAHHIKGGCKCGVFHDLGEVVATYNYNLNGTTYYQVVRYRPKNFRPRTPLPKGGWLNKYPASGKRVLYNLDHIHAAAEDRWILYCEGEKDVETCRKRELTATTHAGGANGWRSDFSSELKGRKVALLPHNDEDSRRMAKRIVGDLSGIVREVKVVILPDLPEHGDITDWFEKGGTVQQLDKLIAEAKVAKRAKKARLNDAEKTSSRKSRDFRRTDLGNAERLIARHGDELRWVEELGWLHWNDQHWTADEAEAHRQAMEVARSIYAEASQASDADERSNLARWAVRSEGADKRKAMLDTARWIEPINVKVGELDRDPFLLNVANGTLDLKTGKLRPHAPTDLITKLVSVDYDPDARSQLWDRFIEEATAGQKGLADFLRRAVGYTLTADVREDAIFLLHGPGGAGKTTFVSTIHKLLSSYADSIRTEALTDRGSSGSHSEDIAVLAGKRMVLAVEASESDRLREGLVKFLTGGEHELRASRKYKPSFGFHPEFKLWIATNHVPRVRSDDSGVWRRLHKLPFVNVPTKPDKTLRRKLKSENALQAVLAWAVKGCLEWQHGGLQPPECVQFATDQLRRSMDSLDEFFEDCCEFEEREFATVKEIRWAYIRWASEQGISERFYVAPNRMADALQERGCESTIRRIDGERHRGYWGVSVREGAHAHGVQVVKK